MRMVAAILIALSSAYAAAQTVTVTWEPPMTRENGEPLDPVTEISHYTVFCRQQGATVWPDSGLQLEGFVSSGSREVPVTDLAQGTGVHECTITATDIDGLESAKGPTDTATFLVRPDPPGTFGVSP